MSKKQNLSSTTKKDSLPKVESNSTPRKILSKHWLIKSVNDIHIEVRFVGQDITTYSLIWGQGNDHWSVWCGTVLGSVGEVIAKFYGFSNQNKEDALIHAMAFIYGMEESKSFKMLWPQYLKKSQELGEPATYRGKDVNL